MSYEESCSIQEDRHPFNSLFSGTTCVGRHQEGSRFWILMKQKMMRWPWHQLNYVQAICTSLLQIDNNTSTSSLHTVEQIKVLSMV